MKFTFSLLIGLLFVSVITCGCHDNSPMNERFPDGEAKILIDEQGNQYAVGHHIGNTYSVVPIKK